MVRMMAPTGYHIIWYFTIINMFKNITDEILLHIYEPSDSTVFFPTLRLICIPIQFEARSINDNYREFILLLLQNCSLFIGDWPGRIPFLCDYPWWKSLLTSCWPAQRLEWTNLTTGGVMGVIQVFLRTSQTPSINDNKNPKMGNIHVAKPRVIPRNKCYAEIFKPYLFRVLCNF